jgi:RecA-family ATPase
MAYREDYLNPETLAKADELDIYFQSQGQPHYPERSSDAPQSYSLAIDDPLPAPKFLTLSDMVSIETNTKMPPQIISGVLYKGSKMIISGSSKAGKTLSLLHLGLAVSNGSPGWATKPPKVMSYTSTSSLKPRMAAQRITHIIAANPGIYKQNPRFLYCGLRGQARSLEDLVHHIEDLPDFKP